MTFYVFVWFLLFGMVLSKLYEGSDLVESMCQTTVRTVLPKVLKNMKNVTKDIVQTEVQRQSVVFETCIDSSCNNVAIFPNGYVGVCIQKYRTVTLLATSSNNSQPEFDSFSIPNCCVCAMKKLNNTKLPSKLKKK